MQWQEHVGRPANDVCKMEARSCSRDRWALGEVVRWQARPTFKNERSSFIGISDQVLICQSHALFFFHRRPASPSWLDRFLQTCCMCFVFARIFTFMFAGYVTLQLEATWRVLFAVVVCLVGFLFVVVTDRQLWTEGVSCCGRHMSATLIVMMSDVVVCRRCADAIADAAFPIESIQLCLHFQMSR